MRERGRGRRAAGVGALGAAGVAAVAALAAGWARAPEPARYVPLPGVLLLAALVLAAAGAGMVLGRPRPSGRGTLRVLSWWWVLAGVVIIVVSMWGSTAVLLSLADAAPDAARRVELRLDAVKTGLTVGAGAAGLVALLLGVRRQWLGERTQAYQEYDAGERRVTELYTKAADQLGHDKAAVRLAGLHALERVAQDTPEQRQTVVDVICAYLRMPPPAAEPGSQAAEHPAGPSPAPVKAEGPEGKAGSPPGPERKKAGGPAYPERRKAGGPASAEQGKAGAPAYPERRKAGGPASAEQGKAGDAVGPEWEANGSAGAGWKAGGSAGPGRGEAGGVSLDAQELQVRATAQRILGNHLRWSRSEPVPPATFWPGIDLDLTGAYLVKLDFNDCRMRRAAFDEATFTGFARFGGATFGDRAVFSGAVFRGTANWRDAGHKAGFEQAVFEDEALFREAVFALRADFRGAEFTGMALFSRTAFHDRAVFRAAAFAAEALFGEAVFTGEAVFRQARFAGAASFRDAAFATAPALWEATGRAAVSSRRSWPRGWREEALPDGSTRLVHADPATGEPPVLGHLDTGASAP
ncbi:pentapeptide repeat-containing protein [Sphaerisporangium sp. TRM90804]|uniref:pentapeptide repeat-containing protein n=1 Tax=Sphaerisporangium sp. TRM90804 TaxID=3031113 RepID=UPI00244C14DC|nr:pentapeptide repeat-containing protein [Sphaerisporangium sp. TRM90804]MDH2425891.1 pentapeptide repeat-containing protein [Sphaerisporangium sp. TRM90804]